MRKRVDGSAAIPSGTYYFPPGSREGNFTQANVNNNGLIPVYFRPKDGRPDAEEEKELAEEDGEHPSFRFGSRERWKKKRLIARLRSSR